VTGDGRQPVVGFNQVNLVASVMDAAMAFGVILGVKSDPSTRDWPRDR
jgi:hypothetical protein